ARKRIATTPAASTSTAPNIGFRAGSKPRRRARNTFRLRRSRRMPIKASRRRGVTRWTTRFHFEIWGGAALKSADEILAEYGLQLPSTAPGRCYTVLGV